MARERRERMREKKNMVGLVMGAVMRAHGWVYISVEREEVCAGTQWEKGSWDANEINVGLYYSSFFFFFLF